MKNEIIGEFGRYPSESSKCNFKFESQISELSTWPDSSIHKDRSQLRILKIPEPPIDLNVGFKSEEAGLGAPLGPLLDVLVDEDVRQFDVITYRNNLRKIMDVPYSTRTTDPWTIHIFRGHNSLLFDVQIRDPDFPPDEKVLYRGRRFEHISGNFPEGTEDGAGNSGQYNSIVRVSLGKFKICIAAEIDAQDENGNFVELKLLLNPKSNNQRTRNFERFQTLKFYIQNTLAGVPRILLGSRDASGILRKTQMIQTRDLPRISNNAWVITNI
eukprot:GHVL01031416.1.p1 GENE.GHVL01031416.1~~GHVL01031416.1.p1  ORF type:complete len:271 (-),score=30.85 GHVL01031416.1:663-1475(-)